MLPSPPEATFSLTIMFAYSSQGPMGASDRYSERGASGNRQKAIMSQEQRGGKAGPILGPHEIICSPSPTSELLLCVPNPVLDTSDMSDRAAAIQKTGETEEQS